jgi:LPS sulfotransferase NodH
MTAGDFDAFVIFAEMRTGSNHLEESLDALPDVTCYGEVFNPTFIGRHNRFELLGYDMDRRERDPDGLLATMIAETEGLAGLRFFHDHDPRVLEPVLANPRIAKVVLTRNPLDSYISRKIAAATGQWRLTDMKHARTGRAVFDAEEFWRMIEDWSAFRDLVRRNLQVTGQAAFHIRYEDINDTEVLNGLARFLGSAHQLSAVSKRLKRQNPGALRDRVENYDEMADALTRMDWFGLDRVVETEAGRAPGVRGFVAHPEVGLLFVPMPGGPEISIIDWMAGIGDVGHDGLMRGLSQKDLRRWMRTHPGFTSFTVLRHPVLRAFGAYLRLSWTEAPRMAERRQILQQRYGVAFPEIGGPDRDAFLAFLGFLKGNLAGQTSLATEPDWATQMAVLQGAARVVLPQRIVREEEAAQALGDIESSGLEAFSEASDYEALATIYDEDIERATFDAYRRDYVHFGFAPWDGP